jgi:peptidoglycan/xylan/chitin deacetylase (PgdA/CDA1 family)
MRTLALLYHDVVPKDRFELSGFQSPDANIYKLNSDEFERHLDSVAATGGKPVTIFDQASNSGRRLMLTFDDGGASAPDIADRLEQRGWRGHFLVTTDFIGTAEFVSESQIRELHRRGHIVGSHSCSHPPRMSACNSEQLDSEWQNSVRRLSDIVGEKVKLASIPGGYYSREVAAAASRAGIRVLFTSEPVTLSHTVGECLVVGRFGVQQGVPREWVAAVVSGSVLPRWQRYIFWNGKKMLKRVGGESWLKLRRSILARRALKNH